jgi:glycosyltransferase involved in cell wall biosynthesis
MKIGIDGSRAFVEQKTGIEEYSYQVIKHLMNKLDKHQVIFYLRKNQKIDFILPKNWEVKVIKYRYLWTQVGLSLELLKNKINVLFIPAHVVPIIHPRDTIVTIHGLEYEFFPEGYSFWARLYMRWSIKMSCRWAKKIIAVSENTKKDLMELYKVKENKISVVYEGVSENLKFEISNFNEKILNFKPYLLFIGRLEKRKNVEGIVEAYKILKEKYKIPHSLVLAGAPGYGYEIIKLKIKNSKLKIFELGYVSEGEKRELIKSADVFIFPTFYEGFGLPILEAQRLGVPVVTSNISSLSEVGGESVFYVDPHEPEIIADAIFKLISDQKLKDDIIKKGCENVKKFSWEKCTDEIAQLLNSDKNG